MHGFRARSYDRHAEGVRRLLILASLATLAGCVGEEASQQPVPLFEEMAPSLPVELQAQLDSGNVAYRARDYDAALGHFTRVIEMDPRLATGWYGVGMTHAALGNPDAAESAMAQAFRLAPELPGEHPGTSPSDPHQAPALPQ